MSDDVELCELEETIMCSMLRLRELKKDNTLLKQGHDVSIGGVLKAYRGGDLDFKEAIEAITQAYILGYIDFDEALSITDEDEYGGHNNISKGCVTDADIKQYFDTEQ